MAQRRKVFIAYKQKVEPDQPLAYALDTALSKDHEVFIDHKLPPGSDWPSRIDAGLDACEVFVVLVSRASIGSDMVRTEIETIRKRRRAAEKAGQPRHPQLLAIHLEEVELPYNIRAALESSTALFWSGPESQDGLVEAIAQAIDDPDTATTIATSATRPQPSSSSLSQPPGPQVVFNQPGWKVGTVNQVAGDLIQVRDSSTKDNDEGSA